MALYLPSRAMAEAVARLFSGSAAISRGFIPGFLEKSLKIWKHF